MLYFVFCFVFKIQLVPDTTVFFINGANRSICMHIGFAVCAIIFSFLKAYGILLLVDLPSSVLVHFFFTFGIAMVPLPSRF